MTHSKEPTELILLPSLKAERRPNGGWILTSKYVSGAEEYAKYWPGQVTSLVSLRDDPPSDMDPIEVMPGKLSTGIELRPQSEADLARRLSSAAMVLAFLSPYERATARLCRRIGVPIVFTSEYTPRTERQIVDLEVKNPLRRWRRKIWLWQAEQSRRAALRDAAGLQCSGSPTYERYRHHTSNSMMFFDNRVPMFDVISEVDLSEKARSIATGRPLRLVFGGRLVAMKGVLQLPRVALELKRCGIPFSFRIYGSGELVSELRRKISDYELQDQVALGGVLDFHSGWLPLLKREADLFVCCHPQGDPSSTYPEVMSCGVPIVGYNNEAFLGIVQHSGGGWLSAMNDPVGLASVLVRLHHDRGELVETAQSARAFALTHTFEATFKRRILHMIQASRLPEHLKEAQSNANT